MVLEHEIPNGSRLYFGDNAKKKRKIEQLASEILYDAGFEEIVTPHFSYHQHESIADTRELIKVNDEKNNSISLRADSTIDVVRILQKRLDRNTEHKKWFYIQSVFRYPTEEHYQIGAEVLDEAKLDIALSLATKTLDSLGVDALVQISNIKIPKILTQLFSTLNLDDFRHINVDKFLSLDVAWLSDLVYLQHYSQLDSLIAKAPKEIADELIKMKELCENFKDSKDVVLAPMYYAKMLYYDELFFRVIKNNDVYARGGRYSNDESSCVGFALYTDNLIEALTTKEG